MLATSALLLCSCSNQPSTCATDTGEESVRTLDDLSSAQLRLFLKGLAGDWRANTAQNRGEPAPPVQQPIPKDARLIDLPTPSDITAGTMPLAQAVKQRRSHREYSTATLTSEELSFLLWCTQGVSSFEQDAEGAITSQFRTVPSGGSRHPFETYLVVNRVEGLEPGLYRFLPFGHKLCLLRATNDLSPQLQQACYGQGFVGEAAVTFIWSAIPRRTEWKYGCIAHRIIAMEAGHICQNLYLASESIGAGACAVLGYSQPHIDALIGVDGQDAFVIYMAAVGKKLADE